MLQFAGWYWPTGKLYGTISKGKSKKTKGQHKNQKRRPLRLTAPGPASCFLRSLFQAAPCPAHLGNSKQYRRIFLLRRTRWIGIFEKWTRKRAERSGASDPRPLLITLLPFWKNSSALGYFWCRAQQELKKDKYREIIVRPQHLRVFGVFFVCHFWDESKKSIRKILDSRVLEWFLIKHWGIMGGERNGVERAYLDSFLCFSPSFSLGFSWFFKCLFWFFRVPFHIVPTCEIPQKLKFRLPQCSV